MSSLALSFSGGASMPTCGACVLLSPGEGKMIPGCVRRSCPPFYGGQKGAYTSRGASTQSFPEILGCCASTCGVLPHTRTQRASLTRPPLPKVYAKVYTRTHTPLHGPPSHILLAGAPHTHTAPSSASRNNTGGLSYNVARSPLGPLHIACSSSVTFSILAR